MQLDKEDEERYRQRAFFEKKPAESLNPMSIFFAVLAAILVSWFLHQLYMEWQLRRALTIFNQQMEISTRQSQRELRSIQRQSQAQFREMQLSNQARVEALAEQSRRREETRVRQNLAEIQRNIEIEATRKSEANKEILWKVFYKPSPGCEAENPNRELIKCGNDYINARRRFETSWAAR